MRENNGFYPEMGAILGELSQAPNKTEQAITNAFEAIDPSKTLAVAVTAATLATGAGHLSPAGASEVHKVKKTEPVEIIAYGHTEKWDKARAGEGQIAMARRNGISLNQIREDNGGPGFHLLKDHWYNVTPGESKPAKTKLVQYTVTAQPGDTATEMAHDHGMSLSQFYEANPKVADSANHWLYSGEGYAINESVPAQPSPAPPSPKAAPAGQSIEIKSGYTVNEITEAAHEAAGVVSVTEKTKIEAVNRLETPTDLIISGHKLFVPGVTQDQAVEMVKRLDSRHSNALSRPATPPLSPHARARVHDEPISRPKITVHPPRPKRPIDNKPAPKHRQPKPAPKVEAHSAPIPSEYTTNFDIRQLSGLTAADYNYLLANTGLADTGEAWVRLEKEKKINGLEGVEHARIESANGTSHIFRDTGNVFGWNAVDSNPYNGATRYSDVEASIMAYGDNLNMLYLQPPNANQRYHGTEVGAHWAGGTTISDIFVHYSTAGQSEAQSIVNMMNEDQRKLNAFHASQG